MVSQTNDSRISLDLDCCIGVQEVEATFDGDALLYGDVVGLNNEIAHDFLAIGKACWHLNITNEIDIPTADGQSLLEIDAPKVGYTLYIPNIVGLVDQDVLCLVEI